MYCEHNEAHEVHNSKVCAQGIYSCGKEMPQASHNKKSRPKDHAEQEGNKAQTHHKGTQTPSPLPLGGHIGDRYDTQGIRTTQEI